MLDRLFLGFQVSALKARASRSALRYGSFQLLGYRINRLIEAGETSYPVRSVIGANKPANLTIQSLLAFKADGAYTYKLRTKDAKAGQVVANGVMIQNGAQFDFAAVANKLLRRGQVPRQF